VFAQDLERRVSEGFPKARRAPAALRRRWMPVLAGAAALILIAVVSISVLGNGDRVSVSSSAGVDSSGGATPDLRQFAAPPTTTSAAPTAAAGRRVERSARLTISTSRDKLQGAADGVGTVAESHRGFVLSSQVNTGDAGSPGGSFVLRVPASELQATLSDLSKLGRMRARSESGQDMTAPYNSVQNRLGNALLERSALKLRLRRAHGRKADDLRVRIVSLNAAIDGLNGRMKDLRKRTVYSTVYVSLEQDAAGAGAGGSGTGAAWHDAVHTLEALVNFMVRALGVLLPLGLLAGIGAAGSRSLRRRRREAALM
jgi:hypothetical protein